MQEGPAGKRAGVDSVTEQSGDSPGSPGMREKVQIVTCNFSKTFFLGLSSSSGWPFS